MQVRKINSTIGGQNQTSNTCFTDPQARFTVVAAKGGPLDRILSSDELSIAMAFIRGELTVQGDLFSAIRFFRTQKHTLASLWYTLAAKAGCALDGLLSGRKSAHRDIGFHYDRSNQ